MKGGITLAIGAIVIALLAAWSAPAAAHDDKPQFNDKFNGGFKKKMDRRDVRHQRHPGFDQRRFAAPQFHSHFKRPYPYHLDYYRMRYGGSYAPYFGNLYGPPRYFSPYYGPQIIAPGAPPERGEAY